VHFYASVWNPDSSAQAEDPLRWRCEYVHEYQVTIPKYLDGLDIGRFHHRYNATMSVNSAHSEIARTGQSKSSRLVQALRTDISVMATAR
jgi:hypothetical protein